MLCKITMRAALAPVIGLIGVLLAGTALAQFDMTPKPPDGKAGDALKIASETLDSAHEVEILRTSYYRIGASSTEFRIKASSDILLTDSDRFVRYDFDGAVLVEAIDHETLAVRASTAAPDDAIPEGGEGVFDIAYGGGVGQDFVVYRRGGNTAADVEELARGTAFYLDLSGDPGSGDPPRETTPADAFLTSLGVSGTTDISVEMSVHGSISDARTGSDPVFEAGPVTIASVKSAVTGEIVAMEEIADVGTPVSAGGAFRRFVSSGMGGASSGVLASAMVTVDTSYRDAVSTKPIDTSIVKGVMATATSEVAGAFAIVAATDGGLIEDNPNPWMVSSSVDCEDGPLDLSVKDGTIATYTADPAGFRKKGDLTPAGIESADQASGLVPAESLVGEKGDDEAPTGYFCVLAKDNENAIPPVGDAGSKNAYKLKLEPQLGKTNPVEPKAIGPSDAGSIKRNGTTVHVSYLTTNEFVDQRLVVVNRGREDARFWIENEAAGGFQLEQEDEDGDPTEAEVTLNELETPQMVTGGTRKVMKVTDFLELEGVDRTSATITVVAPPRDIDVMTIQRSISTEDIDTTLYEAQEQ